MRLLRWIKTTSWGGLPTTSGKWRSRDSNGVNGLDGLLSGMSKMNPDRSGRIASPRAARRAASGLSIVLAWVLAAVLLVSSGLVYRTLAGRLEGMEPIALPVPLERFPLQMDGWTGQDAPLLEATQEYMRTHFADDYISRYYVNAETGQSAGLYVVYCSSQPGGILGHQPQVCYPGTGWTSPVTCTISTKRILGIRRGSS